MKPYVDSGRAARLKLEQAQFEIHGTTTDEPERKRLQNNLRGLKQVINTFGIAAILLVPALGIIAQSAFMAAFAAVHFFVIICVLEIMERGVKREMQQLDEMSAKHTREACEPVS